MTTASTLWNWSAGWLIFTGIGGFSGVFLACWICWVVWVPAVELACGLTRFDVLVTVAKSVVCCFCFGVPLAG